MQNLTPDRFDWDHPIHSGLAEERFERIHRRGAARERFGDLVALEGPPGDAQTPCHEEERDAEFDARWDEELWERFAGDLG